MKPSLTLGLAVAAALLPVTASWGQGAKAPDRASIERGRYLVRIGGCNDCHTAGYGMSGGKVPEAQWLTGDKLGFRGPWGTTYPSNLRLVMGKLTEQEWVKVASCARSGPVASPHRPTCRRARRPRGRT